MSTKGIGKGLKADPWKALSLPTILAAGSKQRARDRGIEEQRKAALTQQKLETERKTAEAETKHHNPQAPYCSCYTRGNNSDRMSS